jgi:hypothetical protein
MHRQASLFRVNLPCDSRAQLLSESKEGMTARQKAEIMNKAHHSKTGSGQMLPDAVRRNRKVKVVSYMLFN